MACNGRFFLLAFAYIGFIGLGLPDGSLGVAWPAIRQTFHLPLDAVAPLFALGMTGGMLSSFNSGALLARWGVSRVVAGSCLVLAIVLSGFAVAPAWFVIVGLSFFAGAAASAIDSGLNTFVATRFTTRHMNWLHACWGIGATTGPIVMTATITSCGSWRTGYAVLAVLILAVAACSLFTQRFWAAENGGQKTPLKLVSRRETLRLPITWISVILFFTYCGLEVATGQWAYSLLVEARGIPPVKAGLWVSAYWASLTLGRFLIGIISNLVPVRILLRANIVGTWVGTTLLWIGGAPSVNLTALMIIGFSLATIFPSLMSDTPRGHGERHAPNAIGFQITASGLGIAALPGLGGLIGRHFGLETLGPYLFFLAALLFLLNEARFKWSGCDRIA